MSNTRFRYTALDKQGIRRRGVVQSLGKQDVFRRLTAEGLTPIKVEEERQQEPFFSFQRISADQVAGLTRELAVLVEARIPIARGLVAIAEHETHEGMRSMVRDMAAMIESGSPVTDALTKYRHVFGDVYIETMRAAEKSGNLASVTQHLAELTERQIETSQQLRRALSYPAIVMMVVALAVGIIVVFVVPRFGATFKAHGVEMPLLTQLLKAVGESAREYWYLYVGGVLGAVGGTFAAWKTPSGRAAMERGIAVTPYVGRIFRAITAGQFSRVLGIGLGSGLDLVESIEMSGRATGRRVFAAQCAGMADRIRGGETLADVLQGATMLPSFARRMIAAGKDSAEVCKACDVVARHYERESSHLTKNINTVIEPLLTLAMAGIVLTIALSVFLPMWQMVKLQN